MDRHVIPTYESLKQLSLSHALYVATNKNVPDSHTLSSLLQSKVL